MTQIKIKSVAHKNSVPFSTLSHGDEFHLPHCCTTFYIKQNNHSTQLNDDKTFNFPPEQKVFIKT